MDDNKGKIEELRKKEVEDLTQILSKKYNLAYLDLSRVTIDLDSLKILDEKSAKKGQLAVFQSVGKKLQVAVRTPNLSLTKQILEGLKRRGYKIELFMVSENSLKKAWSRYGEIQEFTKTSKGLIKISEEKIESLLREIKNIKIFKNSVEEIIRSKQSHRVSEILEIIMAGGLSLEASDVHIEPQETGARMRVRLDGVLQDAVSFDKKVYALLLSRIKLVSELKLNVHDKAQDGRFTIRAENSDIEIRTSILPSPFGESIVLRILNPKTIAMDFESLGMHPYLLKIMEKEIKRPNGMILTTGPTGSGKTTTLYAFLKKSNVPGIKIITIEDPIEYHLEGILQTQVEEEKKQYTFANGLRSILRQDPDIILVGEIRDLDTAETAMHAALTGHLVFSTLHTNNAAGTISRLIDIGVKPSIISPAINISMAQRLVRVLCNGCKQESLPTITEKKIINSVILTLPENVEKPNVESVQIFSPGKCEKCNFTGYKGRIGLFEAILIDKNIEKLILTAPSENEILESSKNQGILNMKQDAVLKIISGTTSFKEVSRVLGLLD